MTDKPDDVAALNTDRELYRDPPGDYYADSLHVTINGAIGINCGGYVRVMPLRRWYDAATISDDHKRAAARYEWLRDHAVFIDCGEGFIWGEGGEYGSLDELVDARIASQKQTEECDHHWVSMINPVIKNGSMCTKCGKLKR